MSLENALSERLVKNAQRLGMGILTQEAPTFPDRLRTIPNPPAVLYTMGNIDRVVANPTVAIIGTRDPSPFGTASARKIAATLASNGFVIVSGLAIGCDTAAHQGCLDVGGQTVAVMPCGLDYIYPFQNRELARDILDSGGCLLSEYPPGTRPGRDLFIKRDRLQSGLADVIIVVETDVWGGTMHTVRFACEQRRPVGCIRHPAKFANHRKTRGNKKLIADGTAIPLPDKNAVMKFVKSVIGC